MRLGLRFAPRSLAVAAAALAVAAAPALAPLLIYDRHAIVAGDVWRLLTAHLVHAGSSHLLWDVLPLLVVGFLWEPAIGRRFWTALGLSTLTVGVGLLALAPGLETYCGLSGVLNGLWVGGALAAARREQAGGEPRVALLYRAGVLLALAKIAFEAVSGRTIFTDPTHLGGTPIPLAHALGALGGCLALLIPLEKGAESTRPATLSAPASVSSR